MKNWSANNRNALLSLIACESDPIVIMSYNIYNPNTTQVKFTMNLYNGTQFKATIMSPTLEPDETIFLDTKIILNKGDYIQVVSPKDLHIIVSGA